MTSKPLFRIKSFPALLCCIIFVFALFSSFLLDCHVSAESDAKVVRVGYLDIKGYQEGGEGEYKTGYGYEYLQKISYYTGWHYEYIYGSFAELFTMLENNEIDLMGDVSFMESREKNILYSAYPQGSESYYIFVRSGTEPGISDGVEFFNGKRIGVTGDSFQLESLKNWLEKYSLNAEIVEYTGSAELSDAMDEGEVDAIIMTDSESQYGQNPVYCIGTSEIYFGVASSRMDILEELDDAMFKIFCTDPSYNANVSSRYYSGLVGAKYMSADEAEWLEQHNNTIRIGYLENNLPYSGIDENGNISGILGVLVKHISDDMGVNVEAVAYSSNDELREAVYSGEIDAAGPDCGELYIAEQKELVLSDPLMLTTPVILYKGEEPERSRVAVNSTNILCEDMVRLFLPDAEQILCGSDVECLRAVVDGRADCVFSSSAKLNVLKPYREMDKLSCHEIDEKTGIYMFMTQEEAPLSLIINKGITLSDAELSGAEFMQSSYAEKTYTFLDFIRQNLTTVVSVLFVAAVSVIFILIYLRRSVIAEQKARSAE